MQHSQESAKAWCGEMIQEAEEEDVSEDELRIKIEEARQRIVRHQNEIAGMEPENGADADEGE